MEFITKNLKTVGIINTILIVAVLVARGITFSGSSAVAKAESIIGAIGLIFGFIYAYKGYKKDDAKYYKIFMYTYVISSAISVAVTLIVTLNGGPVLPTALGAIVFICICLLAFVKDFGKTKSIVAISIVLLINIVRVVPVFFATEMTNTTPVITLSLQNLVLAIIAFIFVVCKYADKEARGTK